MAFDRWLGLEHKDRQQDLGRKAAQPNKQCRRQPVCQPADVEPGHQPFCHLQTEEHGNQRDAAFDLRLACLGNLGNQRAGQKHDPGKDHKNDDERHRIDPEPVQQSSSQQNRRRVGDDRRDGRNGQFLHIRMLLRG